MTSPILNDTHFEIVINRAKLDVCSTSSSFRGIKAYARTDRIVLYILDEYFFKTSKLPFVNKTVLFLIKTFQN